jgi:hypothetical protein
MKVTHDEVVANGFGRASKIASRFSNWRLMFALEVESATAASFNPSGNASPGAVVLSSGWTEPMENENVS